MADQWAVPDRETVIELANSRSPKLDQGVPGHEPINRAARITQAVSLRLAGMTYAQIAEATGYSSPAACQQAIYRASERMLREAIDEFRELENSRLDRLQAAVWQSAMQGNAQAVTSVVKVMERRAKLNGLDAPQQVVINEEHRTSILTLIDDLVPGEVIDVHDETAPGPGQAAPTP
jgi:hypothetical protein